MSVECRRILAEKSKSFALASRLLPPSSRDEVAVVYAFCRYVDDTIDLSPPAERAVALDRLRTEVTSVYAGAPPEGVLTEFADVVHRHHLPRAYVDDLLAGMEMDVRRVPYRTLPELHHYGYCVAGVVGLMLCHLWGERDPETLERAADLGIAMQLTNIARDVEEDLRDGRVYLPSALVGDDFDRTRVPAAIAILLDEADRLYRSADKGIRALPFRIALAVYAARLVYSAIGDRLRARGCDPFRGRAVVSPMRKAWLVLCALVLTVLR